MGFKSVLSCVHEWVERRASNGDCVVDATAGNGNDTLFLARLVGSKGKVYAFDIQQQALQNTWQRCKAAGIDENSVELLLHSHADMGAVLPVEYHGQISAILFNFGYLPNGDMRIVTQTESSVTAVAAALKLLRPGGILTMVLYPGHEGGDTEAEALQKWAEKLRPESFQVLCYAFINQMNHPPFVIAVEKKKAPSFQ